MSESCCSGFPPLLHQALKRTEEEELLRKQKEAEARFAVRVKFRGWNLAIA